MATKREPRLVSLGYGKFARADRIYALVPLAGGAPIESELVAQPRREGADRDESQELDGGPGDAWKLGAQGGVGDVAGRLGHAQVLGEHPGVVAAKGRKVCRHRLPRDRIRL